MCACTRHERVLLHPNVSMSTYMRKNIRARARTRIIYVYFIIKFIIYVGLHRFYIVSPFTQRKGEVREEFVRLGFREVNEPITVARSAVA